MFGRSQEAEDAASVATELFGVGLSVIPARLYLEIRSLQDLVPPSNL